jgi:hypothetical protein
VMLLFNFFFKVLWLLRVWTMSAPSMWLGHPSSSTPPFRSSPLNDYMNDLKRHSPLLACAPCSCHLQSPPLLQKSLAYFWGQLCLQMELICLFYALIRILCWHLHIWIFTTFCLMFYLFWCKSLSLSLSLSLSPAKL